MDTTTKLVDDIERRLAALPRHDVDTWELFVADVVVGQERIGSMIGDVTECVGIEPHEAIALAAAPSDIATLCAKARELDARVDALTKLLEQVRDLDSLHDLSDLMPRIIKVVGENPDHGR